MNNFMQSTRVNSSNLIYSETIPANEIVCAYCGKTKVYNSGELVYKYKKTNTEVKNIHFVNGIVKQSF